MIAVQNQAIGRSGFTGYFNTSLPRDLKIIVFPLGTASFPEITSPISPETVAYFYKLNQNILKTSET